MAKRPKARKKFGIGKRALRPARPRSKPRARHNTRLPGMEDPAIEALERLAQEYANIRDERMRLNQEEVSLKSAIVRAMHQHSKTVYHHAGVTITLIPGEEECKVRIQKRLTEEDADVAIEAAADA